MITGIVIIIYLSLTMGIGGYFYKKTTSGTYFALGERSLPGIIAGGSVMATGSSGWVLLGVAGLAYNTGIPNVFWISVFAALGAFTGWIIIAKRLREMSVSLNALTVPDFLEAVYGYGKFRIIRLTSLIVICITMFVYVGSLLLQSATVLGEIFNWTPLLSIVLTAIFVYTYVYLGGFMAAAYTDFMQSVIMALGSVFCAIFALSKVGGFSGWLTGLANIDPKMVSLTSIPFLTVIGYISTSILAYMAVPQIVIRYMAIRDNAQVKPAIFYGGISAALLYFGALIAGSAGRLIYPAIKNPETIMVALMKDVGPFWAGIFIAAVLSAIMSTINSILHVGATTVSRDIVQNIINPKTDEHKLLGIARITMLIMTISGIFIAMYPTGGILWITWWAWAGLTAFGGPILMAVFWKRATKAGCIAGLLTGFIGSIIWQMSPELKNYLHPCFIAYFGGILAIVIVSLLTKPQSIDIKKEGTK